MTDLDTIPNRPRRKRKTILAILGSDSSLGITVIGIWVLIAFISGVQSCSLIPRPRAVPAECTPLELEADCASGEDGISQLCIATLEGVTCPNGAAVLVVLIRETCSAEWRVLQVRCQREGVTS